MSLSVVIPTRFGGTGLEKTLKALNLPNNSEIIIAAPKPDTDLETLARRYNAWIVHTPPGRGPALAAGADAANGAWLLFLHDDTILSDGAGAEINRFITQNHTYKAAYFTFRQDDRHWKSWLLERFVALRCALLAMPYGDQGLLITKRFYETLGGFRTDYPIMEDVDLIARIGRRRLKRLKSFAITSAVRYRTGYIPRILKNARCLWLYYRGVSPVEIAKIYE